MSNIAFVNRSTRVHGKRKRASLTFAACAYLCTSCVHLFKPHSIDLHIQEKVLSKFIFDLHKKNIFVWNAANFFLDISY